MGIFYLQIGNVVTQAITFNNTDLGSDSTGTATSIQNALVAAGFQGVTVVNVLPSVQPGKPTRFTFNVTFAGASLGIDEPPIEYVAAAAALPVTMTQANITPDMYTLQANVNYTNPQIEPAIAMDPFGNFVVAWANQGQDVSWFNNVDFQRFDKNGNTVGSVVQVNQETTDIEFLPSIAIGADDYVVVTWTHTQDPSYLINPATAQATVLARAFDPQNNPVWNQFMVGSGGYSSVAMDGQDNYAITWQSATLDGPDATGSVSAAVFGREFELENYATDAPLLCYNPDSLQALQVLAQGNWTYGQPPTGGNAVGAQLIRDIFRVSSSSFETPNPNVPPAQAPYPANPASPVFQFQSTWAFDQLQGQVVMDIDGDIASTYQGAGPAVSENIMVPASFFLQYFRDPATGNPINTDLLPYFDPLRPGPTGLRATSCPAPTARGSFTSSTRRTLTRPSTRSCSTPRTPIPIVPTSRRQPLRNSSDDCGRSWRTWPACSAARPTASCLRGSMPPRARRRIRQQQRNVHRQRREHAERRHRPAVLFAHAAGCGNRIGHLEYFDGCERRHQPQRHQRRQPDVHGPGAHKR